jgi:hypothetical protein
MAKTVEGVARCNGPSSAELSSSYAMLAERCAEAEVHSSVWCLSFSICLRLLALDIFLPKETRSSSFLRRCKCAIPISGQALDNYGWIIQLAELAIAKSAFLLSKASVNEVFEQAAEIGRMPVDQP